MQLIDANSDRNLWAHSYERNLQNVLALHREVARAIADEIRPRLSISEPGTRSNVRAVDPAAYDHCVRGRFFWLQRTEKSLNRAMQHFEQAIERDPTYAPAYSGLADTHFYLGYAFGHVPPVEGMPKARAAAEKALALDPKLAEARTSLGLVTVLLRLRLDGRGARALRGDPAEPQLLGRSSRLRHPVDDPWKARRIGGRIAAGARSGPPLDANQYDSRRDARQCGPI